VASYEAESKTSPGLKASTSIPMLPPHKFVIEKLTAPAGDKSVQVDMSRFIDIKIIIILFRFILYHISHVIVNRSHFGNVLYSVRAQESFCIHN